MKTLVNLNEADLRAIAEMVWERNAWFNHAGTQVSLDELRNEIISAAQDRAELEAK